MLNNIKNVISIMLNFLFHYKINKKNFTVFKHATANFERILELKKDIPPTCHNIVIFTYTLYTLLGVNRL